MTSAVKSNIHSHLSSRHGSWLTADELVTMYSAKHSTVTRALRKLRSEGKVTAKVSSSDPKRRKLWQSTSKGTASLKFGSGNGSKPAATFTSTTPSTGANFMNIESAVESVVSDFLKGNKEFSAHDITRELRERVNGKQVTVDGLSPVSVDKGGAQTLSLKVEHDDVKNAVVALYQANKMPGYTRESTGSYWLYKPDTAAGTAGVAAASATPALPASSGNGAAAGSAGATYDGTPTLGKKN